MVQRIVSFLDYPSVTCDYDALPSQWRRSILRIVCDPPLAFEGGPWFPAAIRGAWGHRLRERAEDDPSAAEALKIMFSTLSVTEPGRTVPAPFSIRYDLIGRDLVAELALYGIADFWRSIAFDALVEAFQQGLATRPNRRDLHQSYDIIDAQWSRSESVRTPVNTGSARLVFRTPLRLGPKQAIRVHWPDLVVSLADRVSRMSRWQGVQVRGRLAEWRDLAESLDYRADDVRAVSWGRRSGAQQGRRIEMVGVEAKIDIVKVPDALLPILAIGEQIHVGGHTTLGLGRYELLC